jgi:hypothetical protein
MQNAPSWSFHGDEGSPGLVADRAAVATVRSVDQRGRVVGDVQQAPTPGHVAAALTDHERRDDSSMHWPSTAKAPCGVDTALVSVGGLLVLGLTRPDPRRGPPGAAGSRGGQRMDQPDG